MEIAVSETRLKATALVVEKEIFPDRGHLRESFRRGDYMLITPPTFPLYLLERRHQHLNNFYCYFPNPETGISLNRKLNNQLL